MCFLQHKMFFLTTSSTPLLHVVQAAGLEPGLPGAPASLARIVVKKNLLCCKKKPFSGFKPASGVHLGCLRTFKKVFFYNIKVVFYYFLHASKKFFFYTEKVFFTTWDPVQQASTRQARCFDPLHSSSCRLARTMRMRSLE